MEKIVPAFIIMAATTLPIPALAEEIRQLGWKDLISDHLNSQDPLKGLSQIQKDAVIWAINMLESLPEREPEEYYKEVEKAMPSLKEADIDINKVMKIRKEIQTARKPNAPIFGIHATGRGTCGVVKKWLDINPVIWN